MKELYSKYLSYKTWCPIR